MENKVPRRWLLRLSVQIILTVIAGCIIAGNAIFFGMMMGGVSAAVAQDFTFTLVEDWVCPEGMNIQVVEGRQWESSTEIFAFCVDKNGKRVKEVLAQSLLAIFGLYSLVCFVPLFFPIAIILWILTYIVFRKLGSKNSWNRE